MAKGLGIALLILGLLLAALCVAAGLGSAAESAFVPALASAAGGALGHPTLLGLGLALGLAGTASLARPAPGPEASYPATEFGQLCMASFALLFSTYSFLGVLHDWGSQSVAVCASVAILHLVGALIMGVAATLKPDKNKILFVLGVALTLASLAFWGGVAVFAGGL